MSEMDGNRGTPPASETAIKNLKEVEIDEQKHCKKNEATGQLEYPRCSICIEDIKTKGIVMPCGHMFDKDCLIPWLKNHNQCPVCRHELPTDDKDYEDSKKPKEFNSTYHA